MPKQLTIAKPLIDSDLRVKPLEPEFISGDESDRCFGTTPETRKNLVAAGEWYAPVHFVWINSRNRVYRVSMIRSYLNNRHQPHVHLNEAEALLQKLSPGHGKAKTPSAVAAS